MGWQDIGMLSMCGKCVTSGDFQHTSEGQLARFCSLQGRRRSAAHPPSIQRGQQLSMGRANLFFRLHAHTLPLTPSSRRYRDPSRRPRRLHSVTTPPHMLPKELSWKGTPADSPVK